MSDYCKDCEHQPKLAISRSAWLCEYGLVWMNPNHPACAVFSEKKRTCGECVLPYWRTLDEFGICPTCVTHFDRDYCPIGKDSEICDNFKGEA